MYKLLIGILGGYILAYILIFLKIDQIIVKGVYNILKINISKDGFFFIFIVLGVVFSFLKD